MTTKVKTYNEGNEDACAGLDGAGDCRMPPCFWVHGDLSCSAHLVAVVRMRDDDVNTHRMMKGETKRIPIEVEPFTGPVVRPED